MNKRTALVLLSLIVIIGVLISGYLFFSKTLSPSKNTAQQPIHPVTIVPANSASNNIIEQPSSATSRPQSVMVMPVASPALPAVKKSQAVKRVVSQSAFQTKLRVVRQATVLPPPYHPAFASDNNQVSIAATHTDTRSGFQLYPFITLQGGVAFSSANQSQNFSSDGYSYNYSANQDMQTQGLYGGFAGIETPLDQAKQWLLQIGIAYNGLTSSTVTGSNSAYYDPAFPSNYNYQYNIQSQQVMAQAKLLMTIEKIYHPYVLFGIGPAFNRSYNYQATLIGSVTNPTSTPVFASTQTISLSYAGGIGVEIDLLSHLRMGVGYEYINFGTAKLNNAVLSTSQIALPITLTQKNLYTNLIAAQVTYTF